MVSNEKAIDRITQALIHLGDPYFNLYGNLTEALEEMVTDPESQYQVGLKLLDQYPVWAMKMLAKSGRKEAIKPLMKWLSYGRDIYTGMDSGNFLSVAEAASDALNELVGTNSELQLQVGRVETYDAWPTIRIWATHMLAKSGCEEAIKPLEDKLEQLEEMLKNETLNSIYGPQIREAIETVHKAIKKLGAT